MGQNPWPAKEKISITNPTFKIYGCNSAPYLHPKRYMDGFWNIDIILTIPHILQKKRERKKKRENSGFHIGCNALEVA